MIVLAKFLHSLGSNITFIASLGLKRALEMS